ncbi:MAG: M15 family metallopeptidase [Saprospiraceae bacterium]|nr:M15 family metallopeptidase [Saprospiraceae bacterium]
MEIVADTLGIVVDIRYASENNFTKKQIYDCPRCFFRKEVGEKILAVHLDLKERYGFGIKLFDCYRPSPYQNKLWEVKPDPNYVTPPKKGSIHSRGMAVDLTIVDKSGKELDMGTPFDYFGKEAHTDYIELPDQVLKNRQLLKKIMEIHGFKGIRTEWWHYSYRGLKGNVDKWIWSCE